MIVYHYRFHHCFVLNILTIHILLPTLKINLNIQHFTIKYNVDHVTLMLH